MRVEAKHLRSARGGERGVAARTRAQAVDCNRTSRGALLHKERCPSSHQRYNLLHAQLAFFKQPPANPASKEQGAMHG
jgi:hypothetical protein